MKAISCLLLFLTIAFLTTCQKEKAPAEKLYGSWQLTRSDNSLGDAEDTATDQYLTFYTNGTAESNIIAFADLQQFTVTDTTRIGFVYNNSAEVQNYQYKITNNQLYLTTSCFEGCGWHFIKMK
jgi:hypothetical protein